MSESTLKVYWDACVWISLIMQEPGRHAKCQFIVDEAKQGRIEIWTSSISLAEVFKMKCGSEQKELQSVKDAAFEDYLSQSFVFEVGVDHEIGVLARTLLRSYTPPLKKPNDAIHLATAAFWNLDELHTFDSANLLPLDGKIARKDSTPLKICAPQVSQGATVPLDLGGGMTSSVAVAASTGPAKN